MERMNQMASVIHETIQTLNQNGLLAAANDSLISWMICEWMAMKSIQTIKSKWVMNAGIHDSLISLDGVIELR